MKAVRTFCTKLGRTEKARIDVKAFGRLQRGVFAGLSGIGSIEPGNLIQYNRRVPSTTDAGIEELCARVRALCGGPFTPQTEAELRGLARRLRLAIRQHVQMAKSSLSVKKAAIAQRDSGDE